MGAGYELRPVTIARPAGHRSLALVAALALIGTVAVVVKPWESARLDGAPTTERDRAQVAAAQQPIAAPAAAVPAASSKPSPLGSLARHSGSWGVGASGIGPHNEAEPWADWTPVTPLAIASTSLAPESPSTAHCDGVPTLPTDPLFIAVSHESDVPVDRHVLGWWWDAGTPTPLAGTIHQVTTGDRGIVYVLRNDHAVWSAGRYEFHLVAGADAVALTVCLAGLP